jgi:hypothetical protein
LAGTTSSTVLGQVQILARDANGVNLTGKTLYFSKPVKVDFGPSITSFKATVSHAGG